ncbi:hypothetical protein Tco_0515335 [Tanacetum coccineum]
MLKAGKLSHIIRELKQSSGKEQPKKKGKTFRKEKPQAILMIQSRQKVIRQNITQSFSLNPEMLFPHLRDDEGAEGPLIIEAGIREEQPIVVNKVKEERVKVAINPEHPEQTTPTDMTGVPRQITEHRLNVRKGCQPVRQKKRGQVAERNVAINDEVSNLVTAGIMREVHYHDWLFNSVMVKKSDNSWRMCVDFKDLNKACPKDGYPLPEID